MPNAKSFHLLWAYEAGLIPYIGIKTEKAKLLQQHTVFDLEKLTNMLEASGFEVLSKGSYFIKPFNHEKMQKLMDEGYINENLLNGLYGLTKHLHDVGAEIFVNCRISQ